MDDNSQGATDKTAAMFADASNRGQDAMAKGQAMAEEMSSFGKGNIEALMESSRIVARGFETIGQDAAAYAKKSMEEATAAARTLAAVKSPAEFMKLQSDFMRQSFDAIVAETSRNTEAMLKLAGEVVQPISNRVALAADKVKQGG
jgi:phasin family protein